MLYLAILRLLVLYGSETWTLKQADEQCLGVIAGQFFAPNTNLLITDFTTTSWSSTFMSSVWEVNSDIELSMWAVKKWMKNTNIIVDDAGLAFFEDTIRSSVSFFQFKSIFHTTLNKEKCAKNRRSVSDTIQYKSEKVCKVSEVCESLKWMKKQSESHKITDSVFYSYAKYLMIPEYPLWTSNRTTNLSVSSKGTQKSYIHNLCY